jgi:hypothetical protein
LQRKPSTNFSTIILDILKHNQNIEGCSQAEQPYSDSSLKTLQKAKDYCREELRSCLSLLPQAPDCAPDSDCTGSVHGVSTTSLDLPAVLASPDSNCFPLHSKLSTELAEVLGVLRHLHFLDLLTQASTIPSSYNIVICKG